MAKFIILIAGKKLNVLWCRKDVPACKPCSPDVRCKCLFCIDPEKCHTIFQWK